MSTMPTCKECNGAYACLGCGSLLRKKLALPETPNVWGSASAREYLEAVRDRTPYAMTFPIGERDGALLDLGDGNQLECFLPYVDAKTGDTLAFMPMPLNPQRVIHDPARGKSPTPSQIDACRAGMCECKDTASGWKLTRPLIRGLLGVSDSFVADHAGELAGRLACWCVCVNTVEFMKEVIFNPEFKFPTREASRAARAAREEARRCRAPRPKGRWPSRPRRK